MCWNPLSTPECFRQAFSHCSSKAPNLPQETKSGEFDSSRSIWIDLNVLHDTPLDRDHKTFTDHREFAMDSHFSESASNSEVFEQSATIIK